MVLSTSCEDSTLKELIPRSKFKVMNNDLPAAPVITLNSFILDGELCFIWDEQNKYLFCRNMQLLTFCNGKFLQKRILFPFDFPLNHIIKLWFDDNIFVLRCRFFPLRCRFSVSDHSKKVIETAVLESVWGGPFTLDWQVPRTISFIKVALLTRCPKLYYISTARCD